MPVIEMKPRVYQFGPIVKTLVTLACDTGERYLSTMLYGG